MDRNRTTQFSLKFLPEITFLILTILSFSSCAFFEKPDYDETNINTAVESNEIDEIEWLSDRAETDGYSSKDGYYRMISRDDCSVNLCYIDFQTNQEIYLCNSPNCSHDDDRCSSWFPFSNGVMLPIPVGEKVVILHGGNPSYANILGDDALAKVEIMDADGSNRHKILEFSATEQISQLPRGGLARDSKNVYFVLTDVVENTRTLYSLDTVEGQASPVYTFDQPEEKIVAAEGSELVISYVPGGDDLTADLSKLETKLFRLNPKTREETPLFSYPFLSKAAFDGKIYAVLDTNGTMKAYDLSTGDILFENQLDEAIDFNLSKFYGCFEGKFLVATYVLPDETLSSSGSIKYCAIDVKTGELTELPFIYYSDPGYGYAEPNACFIAAENDTDYMCCYGSEVIVVNFPKDDGTTLELPYNVPLYAMISKDDFWKGVGQLIPVDDKKT